MEHINCSGRDDAYGRLIEAFDTEYIRHDVNVVKGVTNLQEILALLCEDYKMPKRDWKTFLLIMEERGRLQIIRDPAKAHYTHRYTEDDTFKFFPPAQKSAVDDEVFGAGQLVLVGASCVAKVLSHTVHTVVSYEIEDESGAIYPVSSDEIRPLSRRGAALLVENVRSPRD